MAKNFVSVLLVFLVATSYLNARRSLKIEQKANKIELAQAVDQNVAKCGKNTNKHWRNEHFNGIKTDPEGCYKNADNCTKYKYGTFYCKECGTGFMLNDDQESKNHCIKKLWVLFLISLAIVTVIGILLGIALCIHSIV